MLRLVLPTAETIFGLHLWAIFQTSIYLSLAISIYWSLAHLIKVLLHFHLCRLLCWRILPNILVLWQKKRPKNGTDTLLILWYAVTGERIIYFDFTFFLVISNFIQKNLAVLLDRWSWIQSLKRRATKQHYFLKGAWGKNENHPLCYSL